MPGALGVDGVLRIDKPRGPTSHDVVASVRRALGQRSVGHAGTLDPMATGLLVVMAGEATKLSAHLSGDDKEYDAEVLFGAETDTLDAEGIVTARAPDGAPPPGEAEVASALAAMTGPLRQVPPAVSAIKVDGVPLHARARRGEVVEVPPRDVVLHEATLRWVRADPPSCGLSLRVSKGFYVRSFARDLARALGTLGHLGALRRTRSGLMAVDGALDGAALLAVGRGDAGARAAVRAALEGWSFAEGWMPVRRVGDDAVRELGFGRPVSIDETGERAVLVLGPDGAAVCVGAEGGGVLRVARGIVRGATDGC